jgi:WD40 repeat protein
LILAGGAGRNEVRVFDYASGNIVGIIGDMQRSVLSMDIANTTTGFAFGSADSCVRLMDIVSS